MDAEVRVLDTPEAVAEATADLFISEARAAIDRRGAFAVSLAGGNTPKAAYALLAHEPRRSSIDWGLVHVFFGDERCVPPDDAQSNYRMARETFLDACKIAPANIFRIRGELDPQQAADEYAEVLRTQLGDPPLFDLVMLGMGADGHTASLFPGNDPLMDDDRLARAVYASSVDMWRITLTPKVLNGARTVAFGIEGSAKAPAFAAVRAGEGTLSDYPSRVIAPDGRLVFLVDRAAAALLPKAN